ncbi:MAG: phosphopyruvate hydratase [Candidatus Humimicrobiaceae bacterium]
MTDTIIKAITARQLIDCKCRPVVEVDVITEGGALGRGCAPTGSTVGMYESYVLIDNNPSEYHGLSVHEAVNNVKNIIAPYLIGMDVTDQKAIDEKMIALDGTKRKEKLGGNTIYSTSIACLRSAAAAAGQPVYRYLAGEEIKTIPIPSFNLVNGGRYRDLVQPFNEFIIIPYKSDNIEEAVEIGINAFQELRKVIAEYLGKEPEIARSYGYAAPSEDPDIILSLMQKAVDNCGYHNKVAFAIDCASSEMFDVKTNSYLLKGKPVSSDEMIAYAKKLTEKYNLVFIEDLLDENDWESYPKAVKEITRTIILGDDLIVTDRDRLKRAYDTKAIDGFILKPNQVGTITEALAAYQFAKDHNLIAVPSGRSGGVIGDIVMDFAVGLQVGFIKNGAPHSGERIDKLNFLLRACSLSLGCKLSDISNLVRF